MKWEVTLTRGYVPLPPEKLYLVRYAYQRLLQLKDRQPDADQPIVIRAAIEEKFDRHPDGCPETEE